MGRRSLLLVCIGVLSLALFGACKGGGGSAVKTPAGTATPAGTTVTSDDGALSLFIPEGAMPPETDVTITAVALDQLPGQLQEVAGAGTGYLLEPDGLTLSEAATATLTLNRSDLDPEQPGQQTAYALVSFNDTAGREVLDSETAATSGADTITVSAEVAHFSYLSRTKGSLSLEHSTLPSPQPVGAEAEAEVAIYNLNATQVTLSSLQIEYRSYGALAVGTDGREVHELADRPGVDTDRARFRCTKVGPGDYTIRASAVSKVNDAPRLETNLRIVLSSKVDCVEPDSQTTPQAGTPTPTVNFELPSTYKISQMPSCRHNGPGDSDHLDDVEVVDEDGDPVGGAEVALQVEGPGLVSPSGQPVTTVTATEMTDGQGVASFESPIRSFGEYVSTVTGVTSPDGTEATLDPESELVASYTVGSVC